MQVIPIALAGDSPVARESDDTRAVVAYARCVLRTVRAHGDLALALGLAVAAQAEIWLSDARVDDRRQLAPLALAMCAAVLLRRRTPLVAMAGILAGGVVLDQVATAGTDDPIVVIVVLLLVVYSVGAYTEGRAAWVGAGLVGLASLGGFAQDPDDADSEQFDALEPVLDLLACDVTRRRR